jgi:hypothetical protein
MKQNNKRNLQRLFALHTSVVERFVALQISANQTAALRPCASSALPYRLPLCPRPSARLRSCFIDSLPLSLSVFVLFSSPSLACRRRIAAMYKSLPLVVALVCLVALASASSDSSSDHDWMFASSWEGQTLHEFIEQPVDHIVTLDVVPPAGSLNTHSPHLHSSSSSLM